MEGTQTPMRFTVLTLFPEMFQGPLQQSILGRACQAGRLGVDLVDPRDYATGRHRVVDDSPYGGGDGMVMKPEPLVAAIEDVRSKAAPDRVLMLSPQGRRFDQVCARELSQLSSVALICGRYEGVDERVLDYVDGELSVGDFILSGGEPAAWVVIDAVARLLPGVLGNETSAADESFEAGLLEYPQYTRPSNFRGKSVPGVLLSGDHGAIARWRRDEAIRRTWNRRPDLLEQAPLTEKDRELVQALPGPGVQE